jgi:predicted Zn-dependent protease
MIRKYSPALFAALLLAGCTGGGGEVADLKPGERPDLQTDEAGLWMQMDRVESQLKSSGRIVADPALNRYVRDVTCRLSAEYCKDLRLYIVQTPHFNASMAPNGTMQVWTGTLLRVRNESQLAYVLGHEMGHYIRRHSVQRWRSIRSKSDGMAFFTVSTRMAGLGFVGDLAELASMASVMAFSRDHERESDQIGFDMLTGAGYKAGEAPKIWESLIAERDAAGAEKPSVFFASHPTSEERTETLRQRAAGAGTAGDDGRKRYLAAIGPHRGEWLKDELRKRDFEGTEALLEQLLADGYRPGEILFYQGELHRQRGDDGDMAMAIKLYRKAATAKGAPAEVHRSLGMMYWKSSQPANARKSFRNYLRAAPKAEDRAMIQSYIDQLK